MGVIRPRTIPADSSAREASARNAKISRLILAYPHFRGRRLFSIRAGRHRFPRRRPFPLLHREQPLPKDYLVNYPKLRSRQKRFQATRRHVWCVLRL